MTKILLVAMTCFLYAGCGEDECVPNRDYKYDAKTMSCQDFGFHHGELRFCKSDGTWNTHTCGNCNDGMKNGKETDVDCGGYLYSDKLVCKGCGVGDSCEYLYQCKSGNCVSSLCKKWP